MANVTDIYNRALTKLGASRVTAPTEQSVNARACNACYEFLRDAVLRSHPWNFAIQRFSLAAEDPAPAFGPANAFRLPTGWLRVLPPDVYFNFNDRDWIIEGGSILTNQEASLNVRCVMKIEDTTLFDPTFVEALASKMAEEMCEQLTQSNTKKEFCVRAYKDAIRAAMKCNAMEKVPEVATDATWVTARISGSGLGSTWTGS